MRTLFVELTPEQREAIRVAARMAATPMTVLALRSGGKELAAGEERTELLRAAVAREDVSIDLEILAYEQKKDEPNRNFVRFADKAMKGLAESGKGKPFLRDHKQWDSTAIGGRVLASKMTKVEAGHYQVHQTVRLTEPAAVERALRGLLGAVSIGWEETGPVICTACRSEVFDECWHWPGAVITREDGTEERVEWEYTGAALVETSEVPIGGVPTAGLEGIRAALSAQGVGCNGNRGPEPQKERDMKNLASALAAKLGLAATASEDEICTAVEGLVADRAELKVVGGERDRLAAENDTYRQAERKTKADEFIRVHLSTGQIAPFEEEGLRELFAVNEKRARELVAKRSHGCATPVGLAQQSAGADPTPRAPQLDQVISAGLSAGGIPIATALEAASIFGAKDPKAAVAASLAVSGGKVA